MAYEDALNRNIYIKACSMGICIYNRYGFMRACATISPIR